MLTVKVIHYVLLSFGLIMLTFIHYVLLSFGLVMLIVNHCFFYHMV